MQSAQSVLQSGATLLESEASIAKWGNCYKVGQYSLVSLRWMDTHVYWN